MTFDGACFQRSDFRYIQSDRSFSIANTTFERTPDFIEGSFNEPPRLDNATIGSSFSPQFHLVSDPWRDPENKNENDPRPSIFFRRRIAPDVDESARFRALRGMASKGNDHTNELRFNAYEIAARRFWLDKPWRNAGVRPETATQTETPGSSAPRPPPVKMESHVGRFWFGILYQAFSNYGRSVLRPLCWELGVIVVFAVIFFNEAQPRTATTGPDTACHSDYLKDSDHAPTNKVYEAFALSAKNALILDRTDASRRIYGCLYGYEDDRKFVAYPWGVSILSAIESILSAILLFLVGLALRNMFRIG